MKMCWRFCCVLLFSLVLAGCQVVKLPELDLSFSNKQLPVVIKEQYPKVNIRPTPGTDGAALTILRGGDRLLLLAEQGDWLQVRFFDTAGKELEGWIYKYLVEGYEKPTARKKAVPTYAPSKAKEKPKLPEAQIAPSPEPALPKSEMISPL